MKASFNKLMEIREQFPALTFKNEGYQYLSPAIKEAHKEQIDEIMQILKSEIKGIRRFDNFFPRKDGSFSIRVQAAYSEMFTGVVYLEGKDFEEDVTVIQII